MLLQAIPLTPQVIDILNTQGPLGPQIIPLDAEGSPLTSQIIPLGIQRPSSPQMNPFVTQGAFNSPQFIMLSPDQLASLSQSAQGQQMVMTIPYTNQSLNGVSSPKLPIVPQTSNLPSIPINQSMYKPQSFPSHVQGTLGSPIMSGSRVIPTISSPKVPNPVSPRMTVPMVPSTQFVSPIVPRLPTSQPSVPVIPRILMPNIALPAQR